MGREGIRVFWEDHMILREYGGRGGGGVSRQQSIKGVI